MKSSSSHNRIPSSPEADAKPPLGRSTRPPLKPQTLSSKMLIPATNAQQQQQQQQNYFRQQLGMDQPGHFTLQASPSSASTTPPVSTTSTLGFAFQPYSFTGATTETPPVPTNSTYSSSYPSLRSLSTTNASDAAIPPALCQLCQTHLADVRIAPCGHAVHQQCFERFVVQLNSLNKATSSPPNCPICNTQIRQVLLLQHQQPAFCYSEASSPSSPNLPKPPPQVPALPTAVAPHSKLHAQTELRRGKWTQEEELYANALIAEFRRGILHLPEGTTLRNFLARLLHCDPMRISKKFVGSQCIGKQVYRRISDESKHPDPVERERVKKEIQDLERKFMERIAKQKLKREKRRAASESNQLKNSLQTQAAASAAKAKAEALAKKLQAPQAQEVVVPVNARCPTPPTPAPTPTAAATKKVVESVAQEATKQVIADAAQHVFIKEEFPRVNSVENFAASLPRVESLEGLFGFPRVASFDNMLTANFEMPRVPSTASLSSMMSRVASLEQLSNLACAEVEKAPPAKKAEEEDSSKKENTPTKKIALGGLPRVPSLDKSLSELIQQTPDIPEKKNSRGLFRPSSLANLAKFGEESENGTGMTKDSSYLNLQEMGYPLSRVASLESLQAASEVVNANENETTNTNGSLSSVGGIPRISSIEDILALMGREEANSNGSQTKVSGASESEEKQKQAMSDSKVLGKRASDSDITDATPKKAKTDDASD